MAIMNKSGQYLYTGRGPIDAKSLVKTYAELSDVNTWTIDIDGKNTLIAYNGMITAVYLDRDADKNLTDKNGIYFLFDSKTNTGVKKPDVTNEANWHRICDNSEINNFTTRLANIESELTAIDERLSALEKDKVVIRRDNEYNYKKRTDPISNNEICIVDVPGYGLRVKIGDGEKTFTNLPYLDEAILRNIDNLIVKGYFYQGAFYTDATYVEKLNAVSGRIYIDTISSRLYTYNGIEYEPQKTSLPNATAEVAGVVKLYDQIGQNIDGTMTQRAITDELDDKFEMLVDKDGETLIFDRDLY
jgi:hypothetical protein